MMPAAWILSVPVMSTPCSDKDERVICCSLFSWCLVFGCGTDAITLDLVVLIPPQARHICLPVELAVRVYRVCSIINWYARINRVRNSLVRIGTPRAQDTLLLWAEQQSPGYHDVDMYESCVGYFRRQRLLTDAAMIQLPQNLDMSRTGLA